MLPNNCPEHWGVVSDWWHGVVQRLDTNQADILYFWPSQRMEE